MSVNPRIFAFMAIVGFFIVVMFGGSTILFPKNSDKKITPTPTPIIIEHYITVTVTPTPDGHTYFSSEYQNGTRLLQRPFSWIRSDVTGYKDMKVTTIVYDYKFFDKLHWFNPAEYKYVEQTPIDPKNKFMFVFIYCFMDDIIGDDTRMWSFNRSFFAVQTKDMIYRPLDYSFQVRFKELEETWTFNNDARVQAFKSFRAYEDYRFNSTTTSTAGEYNDEIYYLRGGQSNAIDGYLIFEIPKETKEEDLLILANFYTFGVSQWKLKT
jgi:hypothetical protein